VNLTIQPNKRAAEYLRGKVATLPPTFKKLLPEVRGRAFTVARIQDFDVLRDLQDRIAALPEGGDWREIRKGLAAEISPYMDESEEGAKAAMSKAELVLRTNGFQAYATARFEEQRAVEDALPFWKYQTVGDGNVREAHAALDGKVLPADDPFWDTHYPPWDFGCRCVVAAITKGEADRMKAEDADKPEPERRVLEGKALEAAREGRVRVMDDRGVPVTVNVAPPSQREPDGYRFAPGDLGLSLAALRERYPADVWAAFEKRMKAEKVGTADGEQSAWEWLQGKATK